MDESQQQSVEEGAFLSMLEYAANFKKAQIIVGTSHERNSIGTLLHNIGVHNVYEYGDERVINRL